MIGPILVLGAVVVAAGVALAVRAKSEPEAEPEKKKKKRKPKFSGFTFRTKKRYKKGGKSAK